MELEQRFKPLLMSVDETAITLRVSRRKVYQLIQEGQLELRKLSAKHSRVTMESIERYVAALPKSVPGEDPIIRWSAEERARRKDELDAALAALDL